MSNQVEDKVKNIIVQLLAVEPDKVVPGASFVDDLGADSLDNVELMMQMESEFNLKIPDEEVEKLKTVGDVIQYVKAHVK